MLHPHSFYKDSICLNPRIAILSTFPFEQAVGLGFPAGFMPLMTLWMAAHIDKLGNLPPSCLLGKCHRQALQSPAQDDGEGCVFHHLSCMLPSMECPMVTLSCTYILTIWPSLQQHDNLWLNSGGMERLGCTKKKYFTSLSMQIHQNPILQMSDTFVLFVLKSLTNLIHFYWIHTLFPHCHTLYLQYTYSLHTYLHTWHLVLVLHCYKCLLIHLFSMSNLLGTQNGVGWVSDPDLFGSTGLTWVMPSLHTNLPYIKSNCWTYGPKYTRTHLWP